jgi:hypothetical protein
LLLVTISLSAYIHINKEIFPIYSFFEILYTMSTELLKTLSFDFTKLLFNSDDYNVIIKVGDSNFKAHSCILRARSPYFHSALSRDWVMKEGNNIIFEKPNISPKIFEMILK